MEMLTPEQKNEAFERGRQQTFELSKNRKAFYANGDVADTFLADRSPAQPVWYQQGFKTQDDYRNYLKEQRELADKRATPWYGQGFASETDWHNYMREQRFLETMAKKRPQGALDGLTQVVSSNVNSPVNSPPRRPTAANSINYGTQAVSSNVYSPYPRRPLRPTAANSINYGRR